VLVLIPLKIFVYNALAEHKVLHVPARYTKIALCIQCMADYVVFCDARCAYMTKRDG